MMSEKNLVQPLNPLVTSMEPDGLTGFQGCLKEIDNLVYLTFGEPNFRVADCAKEAMITAIKNDHSHYSDPQGILSLRQSALEYYNTQYHLGYESPDNLIVTAGVSEGINVVFQTLLNDREGVIIPEPAYAPYFASLEMARGTKVSINTRRYDFKLTPEQVEKAILESVVPIKAILFNYPANPTGVTYSRAELTALAEVFKKYHLWVISDEIYAALTYDQKHVSLAEIIPDQTILITGLSKSHAMTGYRIGFIFGQSAFIEQALKVHTALTFALPQVIQEGAAVALQEGLKPVIAMREVYRKRRDWLVEQLELLQFNVVKPEGAFYLFAQVPEDLHMSGYEFAIDIATNAGVAVIPGSAFANETVDYVRLSYAASMSDIKEAVRRLKEYFDQKRAVN